jgi:hypothetical protein
LAPQNIDEAIKISEPNKAHEPEKYEQSFMMLRDATFLAEAKRLVNEKT